MLEDGGIGGGSVLQRAALRTLCSEDNEYLADVCQWNSRKDVERSEIEHSLPVCSPFLLWLTSLQSYS